MTLEMAIMDWQQRLDKQAAEIERLRAERDAWRKLVCNHNALVAELKRRIIWPDQNMWPEAYRIDIPPELSADSFESDLRALARTAGGEAPSFAEKLLAARIAPEMEPKP